MVCLNIYIYVFKYMCVYICIYLYIYYDSTGLIHVCTIIYCIW